MTLKQLKYLVGIVDGGLNITSAAERLHTSQPGEQPDCRAGWHPIHRDDSHTGALCVACRHQGFPGTLSEG